MLSPEWRLREQKVNVSILSLGKVVVEESGVISSLFVMIANPSF